LPRTRITCGFGADRSDAVEVSEAAADFDARRKAFRVSMSTSLAGEGEAAVMASVLTLRLWPRGEHEAIKRQRE